MDQQKIGKFIQEQRKKQKLTQEQLAEKLGITKGAVSKWERGLGLMDMSLLKPLSEILEVSIVEIINGETIEEKEVKKKSEEAIEKTIKHSRNKENIIKQKTIIKTATIIISIFIAIFVIYKSALLAIYYVEPIEKEREEKWINALNNQSPMTIYKRTLNEDEYLVEGNIKIRNDFENWERKIVDYGLDDYEEIRYHLREEGDVIAMISISESAKTLLDLFLNEDYYPEDMDVKFTLADRKYFLLKNDINNDLDFLNYIKDNFYKKSNIFSSAREIRENYGFNYFVIYQAYDTTDGLTILKGDYIGYINNDDMYRTINIFREEKKYSIVLYGEKYTSDEYIQDLLSTLEIK